ncbi:ComEC/Rec2 family competence protein [Mucilaginibacter sp. Mucisp84]|uniref:ComEC/Rec2 family competence protein n=1 Tax=Mucilaginibacter sp. Mucisp84 TaxID=3243058 RepID=UPI0039A5927D
MKILKQFAFFVLFLSCTLFTAAGYGQAANDDMYAHFIDVGQGQAILLEFPKGAVLIDAGGQPDRESYLIGYLKNFFLRRADLHNTLNGVFITHQHVDHNIGLQDVAANFTVLNYVDNGNKRVTPTEHNQVWMQHHATAAGTHYLAVTFGDVTANHHTSGYTDDVVDPVTGPVDPKIVVYSGGFTDKPEGWSNKAYQNENNHSLVIRVDYGKSSFLFSGDLEEEGIQQVLSYYHDTHVLDADVMQVGHHGSKNATDEDWLKAVTPKYAVISCGHWNYGRKEDGSVKPLTTYAYAHPNGGIIRNIEAYATASRLPTTDSVGVKGSFRGSIPVFEVMTIDHAVYATAWDGTVVVEASSQGSYEILTKQ